MYSKSSPAAVAAALHSVFASSPYAADSLELWLAVATEATYHLTVPPRLPVSVKPLPVFSCYRRVRTDAEFYPGTCAVRITTGPLSGTTYADLASAAHAVVTACPSLLPDHGDTGEAQQGAESVILVPTWRFVS